MSNRTNETNQLEKKKKTSEVIVRKENLHLSVLSGLGSSLSSVTPDQKLIPRKNKRKETPSDLIIIKEPIRKTVKPRKISKGDSIMHAEKESQQKKS